jgi:hypothetical protein
LARRRLERLQAIAMRVSQKRTLRTIGRAENTKRRSPCITQENRTGSAIIAASSGPAPFSAPRISKMVTGPAQLTRLLRLESAPVDPAPILLSLNRMKHEPAPSIALNVSARETREINPVALLTTTYGRDFADGLAARLPVNLDINDAVEDMVAAFGGAERKLIGVVLNELNPTSLNQRRDKRYA